ncbi:acyltransferase [Niveibacterium sp. SC-1]|uniref:acyltransferase family protein n=1 Tax=Niveibacterium sp. SC-1 TaxID=3135646 RepID=UPI00311E6FD5
MPRKEARLGLIDTIKAAASQLIVLHHLAFYGPVSDAAHAWMPHLTAWLADYGRIAVQAFLVVGGFLAARSLAPAGRLEAGGVRGLILKRYLRLALPYCVMLGAAIVAAAFARPWVEGDTVPLAPDALQLLSHVLLLQDVLGQDALSAGVWYVAIDFQLFVVLLVVFGLARRLAPDSSLLGPMLVAALGAASLLDFNRDAGLDSWAIYFVGAYALGAWAWWSNEAPLRRDGRVQFVAGLLCLVTVLALLWEFRSRIAVAAGLAVLLGIATRRGWLTAGPNGRLVAGLAQISYAVFLIHFPVYLLINAAFARWTEATPAQGAAAFVFAWIASIAAGAAFHRWVEQPAGRVMQRLGRMRALAG